MTLDNPLAWEEWVKRRLLPLSGLLFLIASAIFGITVAETCVTTNGIALSILTIALLTIFYTIFNISCCFVPSLQLRHKVLCVVYSLPMPIWLTLTTFEITEAKDMSLKANSYNSSYWGEGSGKSHGCSWADAGRYTDKNSYDMTCSLLKGRFSISWIILILVSSIFFSFLFGPKRISDREEGERARQDRGDGGEDVEIGAIPAGQAIEGE